MEASTDANTTSKGTDDLELAKTKSIADTLSPIREFLFIGILCSTQFVTQVGLINTLNLLHIIGSDLGISNPGVLSWLVAGYSLTVGTFILLSGRCGDVFGYKIMVIIGFAWFALWNVIAGFSAYSPGSGGQVLLIFSRVLGGIGPAILLPNALGLLGATYSQGLKKNMIFSLFGACAPVGAVVGGTFAGLWSLIWWPWTFWTFGIALAVLAALSVFILPSVTLSPDMAKLSHRKKLGELDLLGATIGITAMVLFNFAWNQAPGFGWEEAYIYVLLIVGVLLFPVFFWYESKVATKPLIPFQTLSMDVSFVLICEACGWASFGKPPLTTSSFLTIMMLISSGIFVYYYIQILQTLRGTSPLLTMAQLSPLTVSGALASITTGQVISRIGPGWVMLISMLAFLVGSILVATMPVDQTYWKQAFVATIIMPWGMDMSFPAGTLIMSDTVGKRYARLIARLRRPYTNKT
jgi:MFS family permease